MKSCLKVVRCQKKIQKLLFDLARKKNGKDFLSGRAREKINHQIEILRNQIR